MQVSVICFTAPINAKAHTKSTRQFGEFWQALTLFCDPETQDLYTPDSPSLAEAHQDFSGPTTLGRTDEHKIRLEWTINGLSHAAPTKLVASKVMALLAHSLEHEDVGCTPTDQILT